MGELVNRRRSTPTPSLSRQPNLDYLAFFQCLGSLIGILIGNRKIVLASCGNLI